MKQELEMKKTQQEIVSKYWDTLNQYNKVKTDTITIRKLIFNKKYRFQLATKDKSLVARFNSQQEFNRIIEANQLLVELILQSTKPFKYPKKEA